MKITIVCLVLAIALLACETAGKAKSKKKSKTKKKNSGFPAFFMPDISGPMNQLREEQRKERQAEKARERTLRKERKERELKKQKEAELQRELIKQELKKKAERAEAQRTSGSHAVPTNNVKQTFEQPKNVKESNVKANNVKQNSAQPPNVTQGNENASNVKSNDVKQYAESNMPCNHMCPACDSNTLQQCEENSKVTCHWPY